MVLVLMHKSVLKFACPTAKIWDPSSKLHILKIPLGKKQARYEESCWISPSKPVPRAARLPWRGSGRQWYLSPQGRPRGYSFSGGSSYRSGEHTCPAQPQASRTGRTGHLFQATTWLKSHFWRRTSLNEQHNGENNTSLRWNHFCVR